MVPEVPKGGICGWGWGWLSRGPVGRPPPAEPAALLPADLFDILLPMLNIYQEFVRNHQYSLQILAHCKQNRDFDKLLKHYEAKPDCEERTLETFLTYPMFQVLCAHPPWGCPPGRGSRPRSGPAPSHEQAAWECRARALLSLGGPLAPGSGPRQDPGRVPGQKGSVPAGPCLGALGADRTAPCLLSRPQPAPLRCPAHHWSLSLPSPVPIPASAPSPCLSGHRSPGTS